MKTYFGLTSGTLKFDTRTRYIAMGTNFFFQLPNSCRHSILLAAQFFCFCGSVYLVDRHKEFFHLPLRYFCDLGVLVRPSLVVHRVLSQRPSECPAFRLDEKYAGVILVHLPCLRNVRPDTTFVVFIFLVLVHERDEDVRAQGLLL